MRKIIFKTNDEYLTFYNKYKEKLTIYSLDFTKNKHIRLFYDIMVS